jgi:hypothetical protein
MSQIRNRPINSTTNEIYAILINTLKSGAKLQKGQEAIYEKLIQSKLPFFFNNLLLYSFLYFMLFNYQARTFLCTKGYS